MIKCHHPIDINSTNFQYFVSYNLNITIKVYILIKKISFDLNINTNEPNFDSEILHSNIYQNQ